MVIEIDRKKVAKSRQYALITISVYLLSALIVMIGVVQNPSRNWWLVAFFVASYVGILISFGNVIRRVVRFIRTDHHIFLDETGLSMIDGHARIDIPWGDIDQVVQKNRRHPDTHQLMSVSEHILIKLRPDTPYNKRKYRLYNDYEQSLHDIYDQIETLRTAGQNKPKLLEE